MSYRVLVEFLSHCREQHRVLDLDEGRSRLSRFSLVCVERLEVITSEPAGRIGRTIEGTPDAGFPDEIAPRPEDYVFLKRRPSAFYGTGAVELLRLLRRSALVIGGGATNRGVETSVREAFSMDLDTVVVRECCWGGDAAAHAYSLDKSMKMYARVRTLQQTLAMLT